jgi:hypothetical protein
MLPRIPPAPAPIPEPLLQLPAIDAAALLAQLQQLTATVQTLQHQNAMLQDQLDAQAVAAALPTPVPPLAFAPEIKIAMPDAFYGASDRTEHFLHQCKVYFLGTPSLTAQQHVTFELSYMSKGQALSWVEWTLEAVTHHNHVADWGVFKEGVWRSFGNSDCITTAQLKIKEIKQGCKSVDDYIIQFEEHEGFTRFDDAALVEIFKEGLSAGILSHCYGLEAVPLMLTAWKEKSRLFYRNYIELQQWQQHSWGPQPQQCQQQHQPQPGSSHQGGQNPPVPAFTSTTSPVKSESTDAKLGWTHHGKCYRHSGEGHWAWNCPQKGMGPWHSGAPQQCCQIRAAHMSESQFEERVNNDEKGKGKAKEAEREVLPDRVKQMGIDWWGDSDKKDLAEYLKGQGFWTVLVLSCLVQRTYCTILVMSIILKIKNVLFCRCQAFRSSAD